MNICHFFILFEAEHMTINLCENIKGVELFYYVFTMARQNYLQIYYWLNIKDALTSHKTSFLKRLPFGKIIIITIYKASEMLK